MSKPLIRRNDSNVCQQHPAQCLDPHVHCVCGDRKEPTMTDEPSGVVNPEPDGQAVAAGNPTPEPSLDDVVYIVVVRSAAPKNGREIPPILDALVEAGVEPVTYPLAAAKATERTC
jgi:hypothetical protein